jgi:hypothetical protein
MLCDEEIKKQKRPIKYCFWRIVKGRRCPRGVASNDLGSLHYFIYVMKRV